MESVPYKLSEGLYLEGSGQVLPWFKSLHQITIMGGKPLPEKGKTSQLFWEQETIFDDLVVSIQAMQQGNGIFFLQPKNQVQADSAQIEYDQVKSALLSKFGSPTEVGENDGYPFTRWSWGNICMSLTIAERFMDYVSLSVSNGVIKNSL